jgi:hypothetical protein
MLKREIKFEDFNGQPGSVICYFNISKPEIIELEVAFEQGFSKLLEEIVENKDSKELVQRFKEIILMAYGIKSEDGNRFIKSDKLREEFSQTAAYEALFMELLSSDNAAAEFITAILPKDLAELARDSTTKDLTATKLSVMPSPPIPPTPPNS